MIKIKTFSFSSGMFTDEPKAQLKMQDFLNQIGQENIIHFTSHGDPSGYNNYTIVYNDNSET